MTNAVAIQKTFVIHLYISYNTHVDGCSVDGVSEPDTGVEIYRAQSRYFYYDEKLQLLNHIVVRRVVNILNKHTIPVIVLNLLTTKYLVVFN